MDSGQALSEIQRLVAARRYQISLHAKQRMIERQIDQRDLQHAIAHAVTCGASGVDQVSDWTVTGPDVGGESMQVAVAIDDGVVVITVF